MKYKLNQVIYYMRENRIHSAKIRTRMMVENSFDGWKDSWQHFGESGIKYVTCHGVITESEAFASKKELVESYYD